eukprot:8885529-Pyramimonas_sp.AAC.1
MQIPDTLVVALAGPLSIPGTGVQARAKKRIGFVLTSLDACGCGSSLPTDGGKTWYNLFDDKGNLIEVRPSRHSDTCA